MAKRTPLPTWAARVDPAKLCLLYRQDAQGLRDDALLDEVSMGLYARVCSCLEATRAHVDNIVRCPACEKDFTRDPKAKEIACPCGWRVSWHDYHATYRSKQLHCGGAIPFMRQYIRDMDRAREPAQRMLAIDALIHAFHCELEGTPTRPAACNVLAVRSLQEAFGLILSLAYAPGMSTVPDQREAFAQKMRSTPGYVARG